MADKLLNIASDANVILSNPAAEVSSLQTLCVYSVLHGSPVVTGCFWSTVDFVRGVIMCDRQLTKEQTSKVIY